MGECAKSISGLDFQRPTTEKYKNAVNSLPEHLQPIFEDMVASYQWAAFQRHDWPIVSYQVIVDLVNTGWRLPSHGTKEE